MDLARVGAIVGIGAGILAILGAVVGATFYFNGLDNRVKRLEEQVHTLTVAPLITQAITTAPIAPASPTASHEGRPSNDQKPPPPNEQNVVANPVATACRNLADTLAEQIKNNESTLYISKTEAGLQTLGCVQHSK
jgi:hypothetical protein